MTLLLNVIVELIFEKHITHLISLNLKYTFSKLIYWDNPILITQYLNVFTTTYVVTGVFINLLHQPRRNHYFPPMTLFLRPVVRA